MLHSIVFLPRLECFLFRVTPRFSFNTREREAWTITSVTPHVKETHKGSIPQGWANRRP